MKSEILENRIKELENEIFLLNIRLEFHELFDEHSNTWDTFSDKEGQLFYVSSAFERITGYSKEDYINGIVNFLDLIHPDDVDKANFNFQRLRDNRLSLNFTCRVHDKSKSIKWVSISSNPVYNQKDEYLGFRTSVTDITELVLTEELSREREKKYSIFLEESSDPFFSFTPEGQYIYVNSAFAKGVERNVEDIIGKKIWDIFPQEEADKRFAPLSEVFRTGIEKVIEVRVPRREEDKYYLTSIIPIKDSEGKVVFAICSSKEITERKKVEQALLQSQNSYKKIIENLSDIYYRVDCEGKLTMASPSCIEVFGYSSMDEILGQSLELLYQKPNERAEFVALIKQTGKVKNYRTILTKKDGSDIYVETTASILLDSNGEYIGVEGIVRDITDRKLAELALIESEERYRKLVEQSPFSIAIYQDGVFVYVNPAGVTLIGAANQQDLIGRSVLSIIHPDSFGDVIRRMELVADGISVPPMEEKLIRLDGSVFDAEVVAIATTFNNKPAGQVIVKNITERKQSEQALKESEEKWKTIINTSPDGIAIASLDGEIIFVSEKLFAMLGYSVNSEMKGRNIFEFLDESYHFKATNLFGELLKGNYTGVAEFQFIKKDGSRVFMEINAEILHDNEGTAQSVFFALRDITERKQAEEELMRLNHQQKELNATKDKLFSIIAHDLRSPFSSILGFSELLIKNIRKYEIDESVKFIEQINISAKHTLNLLDNLLDWAKTQTGQIDFKPQEFSLQPVIQELVSVLNPSAEIKGISLNQIELDDIEVYADHNMLKTILRNMISNAIKFTHLNGKIDISAISKEDHVEFTVADNGIGMDNETVNKLFGRYINPTIFGTANEKGSGLGLILCKEFIEKHGGRIWVISEIGKGSEFKFILPKFKAIAN